METDLDLLHQVLKGRDASDSRKLEDALHHISGSATHLSRAAREWMLVSIATALLEVSPDEWGEHLPRLLGQRLRAATFAESAVRLVSTVGRAGEGSAPSSSPSTELGANE